MQILSQNNIPHPKTMLVKNPIDSGYVQEEHWFSYRGQILEWYTW